MLIWIIKVYSKFVFLKSVLLKLLHKTVFKMKGWKKVTESKANKWSLKWFLFNGVREGALVIYWLSYNGMYRNFSASFSFFLFSKHEQQLFWVVKANDPCIPGIFIGGIRGVVHKLPFLKKWIWLLENLVTPVKNWFRHRDSGEETRESSPISNRPICILFHNFWTN